MEKKELIQSLQQEARIYKYSVKGRVRFHEVDSYNVVHNLQYFYWLEWARLEYFRAIGIEIERDTFLKKYLFMSVHAEIDYFNAARFDDEYEVLSRITEVKNSSVKFRNMIRLTDGTILVVASVVLVHMNTKEKTPKRIPDHLRKKLLEFEGADIKFTD